MTAQVLFFDVFFEKDPHFNAIEVRVTSCELVFKKIKLRVASWHM